MPDAPPLSASQLEQDAPYMHGAERPVSSTRGTARVQPGEPPPPELSLEKQVELIANEKLQKAGMFMKGRGDKLKQWFDEVGDDAKKKVHAHTLATL